VSSRQNFDFNSPHCEMLILPLDSTSLFLFKR